jgi:predicted transcriptional regulator
LNKKQDVILKFIREGKSQTQISKQTGICRETIRKYIKDYEARLVNLTENLDEVEKINIIDDITSKPKYSSLSQSKRALTDDVIGESHYF